MASYVITAEGSWPINDLSPREPLAAEMFKVTRDGEPARPVIAHVDHGTLRGLEEQLRRDGLGEDLARLRARAVLRQLGADTTRVFAAAGSLRFRVKDDEPLSVPVEIDGPAAVGLARSSSLRLYERGDQVGESFEVDD